MHGGASEFDRATLLKQRLHKIWASETIAFRTELMSRAWESISLTHQEFEAQQLLLGRAFSFLCCDEIV